LERAILANSIDKNRRFLYILSVLGGCQFAADDFLHKGNNFSTISLSVIVKLITSDVESESRVTVDADPFVDNLLLSHVDSCNDEATVLAGEVLGKLFIIWSKSDAMTARGRVVLNKNIVV